MNLKRKLCYSWYLIKHKWYVFLECCKLGVPIRGIFHDWSKFLPSEWIPYSNHIFKRNPTGYYKPNDTGDLAFDHAWFLHQRRNPHHWQYWVMIKDDLSIEILPMPENVLKEMLADWRGAGRAQGNNNTLGWYLANRDKIFLHPISKKWIEDQLGCTAPEVK